MEPCLFRHGKSTRLVEELDPIRASMEPCLFRHGKGFVTNCENWEDDMLQWSHVFSDMVRGSLPGSRLGGDVGFNGAMSFQTW